MMLKMNIVPYRTTRIQNGSNCIKAFFLSYEIFQPRKKHKHLFLSPFHGFHQPVSEGDRGCAAFPVGEALHVGMFSPPFSTNLRLSQNKWNLRQLLDPTDIEPGCFLRLVAEPLLVQRNRKTPLVA